MKFVRILTLTSLAGGVSMAQAADLYFLQYGQIRRYDTSTNSIATPFGAGYGVGAVVGGAAGMGLEVDSNGIVYAEGQTGGFAGPHLIQRFDGRTGTYLNGYTHPSNYNTSLNIGVDGTLYMTATGGGSSTFGGYNNGLQHLDPVTGANLGNLIEPGPDNGLYSLVSPTWIPGGDLLVNHGDSRTIRRYDATTGAYQGLFASFDPPRSIGALVYNDGILYMGSSDQVAKFRISDGAFLGNLLTGPLHGAIGRMEIADGQLFIRQSDPATFATLINRYDLATGAFLNTLNTNGPVDNFAIATNYSTYLVPEPTAICTLGFGALLMARRRRR